MNEIEPSTFLALNQRRISESVMLTRLAATITKSPRKKPYAIQQANPNVSANSVFADSASVSPVRQHFRT